jgi:hypothetical protein
VPTFHWKLKEAGMAQEKVTNAVTTQLNGAINNSVTTITVDSTTGWPSAGSRFRLKIDDEILTCTNYSGLSVSVIRGEEGTTAASHLDNAEVKNILTAQGLRQSICSYGVSNSMLDTYTRAFIAGEQIDCGSDLSFGLGQYVNLYAAYVIAIGSHHTAQNQLCICLGAQTISRFDGALVFASGNHDYQGANTWGPGTAQTHKITLTAQVSASSGGYLARTADVKTIHLPLKRTAVYDIVAMAVSAAGAVSVWRWRFTYQRNAAGDGGDIIGTILDDIGSTVGWAMNTAPSMYAGNELSATLSLEHLGSSNDLVLYFVNNDATHAARVVAEVDVLELYVDWSDGGYY